MSQLFTVRGLVGFAGKLRKAIKANADLGVWQQQTEQLVASVNAQLQSHKLSEDALTRPTRNAYEFLRGIDFEKPRKQARDEDQRLPKLRFPGMQAHLNSMTRSLSRADGEQLQQIGDTIRGYSEGIERSIERDQIVPQQLSAQARAARGWFAWLSDHRRLQQYHQATTRLQQSIADMSATAGLDYQQIAVQFRPIAGLYRRSSRGRQLDLLLPTAMIMLPAECLDELAANALGISRAKKRLNSAIEAPAYQTAVADLDRLGGRINRQRGQFHDLGTAFDRVNQRYFGGGMDAPDLYWSGRQSYRKLGHFDPFTDSIMIASTLDSADVPQAALDFVMFHELLHKQHGIDWSGDQARAHTPAFRRDEKRYPDKDRIEKLLSQLCATQRRSNREY